MLTHLPFLEESHAARTQRLMAARVERQMDMCAQLAAIGLDIASLVAEEARAGYRVEQAAPKTTPARAAAPPPHHPSEHAAERIAVLEPKFHALLETLDAEPEPPAETTAVSPRLADQRETRSAVRLYQYALRAPRLKPISAAALFYRLARCVRAFITLEVRLAVGDFKTIAAGARSGIRSAAQTAATAARATRKTIQAGLRCVSPLKQFGRACGTNPNRARLLRQTYLSNQNETAPPFRTPTKITHNVLEYVRPAATPTISLATLAKTVLTKIIATHAAAKPPATAPP